MSAPFIDHPPPEPLVALVTSRAVGGPLRPVMIRGVTGVASARMAQSSTLAGVTVVFATYANESRCMHAAARVIPPNQFYVCVDEREARRLWPEAFL